MHVAGLTHMLSPQEKIKSILFQDSSMKSDTIDNNRLINRLNYKIQGHFGRCINLVAHLAHLAWQWIKE